MASAAAATTAGTAAALPTAAAPQTIVCEFCHSKIDRASRFCPECGQPLE
jgi:predicted amidophosphoribosyltransferase